MKKNISWSEQYKHPQWQKKRLEVLAASNFECDNCGDKDTTLNVHHKHYIKGRKVWEYEIHELNTLCEPCHETEHRDKDLLSRLIADVGPTAARQAACLAGGYWDANCDLDIGLGDAAKEADPLYYELGMAAACLEHLGIEAWREVIRKFIATHPFTPTIGCAVDEWEKD